MGSTYILQNEGVLLHALTILGVQVWVWCAFLCYCTVKGACDSLP